MLSFPPKSIYQNYISSLEYFSGRAKLEKRCILAKIGNSDMSEIYYIRHTNLAEYGGMAGWRNVGVAEFLRLLGRRSCRDNALADGASGGAIGGIMYSCRASGGAIGGIMYSCRGGADDGFAVQHGPLDRCAAQPVRST